MTKLVLGAIALSPGALGFWDYGHNVFTAMIKQRIDDGSGKGGLTQAHWEKLEKMFLLWQGSGDFPCTETYCAKPYWGGSLPDYLRFEEGRFKNHSDGRDEWKDILIRGLSEKFNDEQHWFISHFPVEKCIKCWRDETCDYNFENPVCDEPTGDEFCYIPCNTEWPMDWGAGTLDGVHGWMVFLTSQLKAKSRDTSDDWSVSVWNRLFWFWIHMYADLHTPLHFGGVTESSCMSDGSPFPFDGMGSFLSIHPDNPDCPDQTKWPTMAYQQKESRWGHHIWDSMMWHDEVGLSAPRTKSMEDYWEEFEHMGEDWYYTTQLEKDAKYLLEKHPYDTLNAAYDLDAGFERIAQESHWVSRHQIYNFTLPGDFIKAVDCSGNANNEREQWKCVPDSYIVDGHETMTKRLVLSVYRAEKHLAEIIDQMPVDDICAQVVNNREKLEMAQSLCAGKAPEIIARLQKKLAQVRSLRARAIS